MTQCPFCSLDNLHVVADNDYALAIYDNFPLSPGLLSMLSGRGIIPPHDRDLWPSQEFLHEHRREWRL